MGTTRRNSQGKRGTGKMSLKAARQVMLALLAEKSKAYECALDFRARLSRDGTLCLGIHGQYVTALEKHLHFHQILYEYLNSVLASSEPVDIVRYNRVKVLVGKCKQLMPPINQFEKKLLDFMDVRYILQYYLDKWIQSFEKSLELVKNAKSLAGLEGVSFPPALDLEKVGDIGAHEMEAEWDNMAVLIRMDEYTNLLQYLMHPIVSQKV